MKLYFRILFIVLFAAAGAWAQNPCNNSGSDGALNFATPGVVVFDPVALGNLDPSGDNVFEFSTINIAAGVTVQLTSSKLRGKPVNWCASGNVTIAGTLDLSGAPGANVNTANPWLAHQPAQPGPGGYAGGLGGVSFGGVSVPTATAGFGPGAACSPASVSGCWGAGAAHATVGSYNTAWTGSSGSGTVYGNSALTPIIGGSGGNGVSINSAYSINIGGGNGGAGGGAIRIISATSITVSGSILSRGGSGGLPDTGATGNEVQYGTGGGGSGGSIHLIAPTISGAGTLDVSGGARTESSNGNFSGGGGVGRILLSATNNNFTGTENGIYFIGPLYIPPTITPPAVTITSVNGVAAPAVPGGNATAPDVIIAASGNVTVNIAASQVPLGTQVTLTLIPLMGTSVSATCTPLAGTTASSTATCSITFPTGVSFTAAYATW